MLFALALGMDQLAAPATVLAQAGGLWALYSAESAGGGPPSSVIRAILPLEDGLWATTDKGVGYYDGHRWQRFGAGIEGPNPAQGAWPFPWEGGATPVALVSSGEVPGIWFGTPYGIAVRRADGTWIPFPLNERLPGKSVTALLTARDGTAWIGTQSGVARWDGNTLAAVEPPGPAYSYILALAEDASGWLWIGTQADGLHLFDGKSWTCYTGMADSMKRTSHCVHALPGDGTQVNALAPDGEGGLWIGTHTGLAYFDGRAFRPLPDGVARETDGQRVLALWLEERATEVATTNQAAEVATTDLLWIGMERGVAIFDGREVRQPVGAETVSLGGVAVIAGDREGNVWLGTDDGLWRYRHAWEPLRPDGRSVPAGSGPIVQDPEGGLWFGMGDFAARLAPDGTWQRLEPVSDTVSALLVHPDGELWLGSYAGAFRRTADGWEPLALPVEQPVFVYAMALDGAGAWLGTNQGLGRLARDGAWTPAHVDLPKPPSVYSLLPEEGGVLWAGTSHGLLRLSPSGDGALYTRDDGLPDQSVLSLYRDGKGQLWIGTRGGVVRWQGTGASAAFERPAELEPLDAQEVRAIAEDRLGRLWFGTRRGAFVYDGELLVRFTIADGLASNDVRGLFRDHDGRLWLATAGGVQGYEPGKGRPRLSIGLRAGNDLIAPRDGRIALAWNQRDVRVEVNAGDLATAFGELTFCYQMQPLDPARRCTNESVVPYRLTPGNSYRFTITALDKDGNRSEPVELPVEVAPVPFTEKPWFRSLAVIGPILAVLGFASRPLYVLYKRRDEYRCHQDVYLTLRQGSAGAAHHVAEAAIRYQGLPGLHWRWRALWRGHLAGVFEPVERLPAASLSRPKGLEEQLRWLEERLGIAVAEGPAADEDWPQETQVEGERADEGWLQALGSTLFQAAFPEDLAQRLKSAQKTRQRVRIRLCFDAAGDGDLARLPWECAYHDGLGFLAQHTGTTLVRYLDQPQAPQPRLHGPLRVLVVMANGKNLPVPAINTAAERQRLEDALGELQGQVEMDYLVGRTAARLDLGLLPFVARKDLWEALRDKLSGQKRFDVVHFIGHAGPHWQDAEEHVASGEVVLYAENAQGEYAPLGSWHLVNLLDGLRDQGRLPRLFFLNACQTGDVAGGQSLAGLIPAIIAQGHVPAVVGMQYPVADQAARQFAGAFYRALLQHGQADWAIAVARDAVAGSVGEDQPDWGIPVLYLQARDGFIFRTY